VCKYFCVREGVFVYASIGVCGEKVIRMCKYTCVWGGVYVCVRIHVCGEE